MKAKKIIKNGVTMYYQNNKYYVPSGNDFFKIYNSVDNALESTLLERERAKNKEKALHERKQKLQKEKDEEVYTFGFADNYKGVKKNRIISILNKIISINGDVGKRKDVLYNLHKDGYMVMEKNGKKRLCKGNSFFTQSDITKTGIEFIEHLENL